MFSSSWDPVRTWRRRVGSPARAGTRSLKGVLVAWEPEARAGQLPGPVRRQSIGEARRTLTSQCWGARTLWLSSSGVQITSDSPGVAFPAQGEARATSLCPDPPGLGHSEC